MGKLDDYQRGMINSLDPEVRKEGPNDVRSKEYWAKYCAETLSEEGQSRPLTKEEKRNYRNAVAFHIIMAIGGCALWIALIVFLFNSCSGG